MRGLLYSPPRRRILAATGFPMRGKSVLLIIGGGIAAYKSLELIRRLAERGVRTPRHPDQGRARSSSRRCRCRR